MDSIRVSKGVLHYGSLHLTAHHLIFRYEDAEIEEMWVPYPLISLVVQLPQTLQGQSPITFHTRTFETFSLLFRSDRDAVDVFESVKELTVCTSVNQLYAFFYSPNPPFDAEGGWSVYSPRKEFGRMGVGSRTKAWRFTDINKDYQPSIDVQFSPTYPSLLVIPTRISDSTLTYAGNQPMVGIKQNRSVQDEKLVEAIFQSHRFPDSRSSNTPVYGATATNLIVDARPTANAMANTARGAGTENMENYKDAKKTYSGIDHIHAMLVDALREADAVAASVSGKVLGEAKQLSVLDRQALRRSGWLRHLSNILEAVVLIVRNVHIHSSHVLVHCSDGWDRTSQLAALSQICLDPYYRTMRGFQVLVEKDWISFGHRFLDRCGHLSSEKFFTSVADSGNAGGGAEAAQAFLASVQNRFVSQHHIKETSPAFHQFLECLRQIQRRFPERFEFNERFLRTIHYHLYSCQFGTFLYNSEQERRRGEENLVPSERTASLWDFLNSSSQVELHKNPSYDPLLDDPSSRDSEADMGVLIPNARDVRFWHELYGRTDEEMNGKIIISQVKEDPEFVASIEVVPSVTLPQPATMTSSPTFVRSSSPAASEGLSSNLQGQGGTPLRPSSPGRIRSPNAPDFFTNSGVRSVWGKLSSNATAACMMAVAKDLKVASRPFEDNNGDYYRGRELQASGFSVDGDRFTSRGSAPSSPMGSSSLPWDSVVPQRNLAEPVMDNPWSSVRSSTPQPLAIPRDMDDAGSLPRDPTIAQPPQRQNPVLYHPPKQGSGVGTVTHVDERNVPEQETERPSLTTDPLGVGLV
ncbi:phosphatases II [Pisolithus sp. B1]|nr:phosphatases II [Pisolithus sp. B1]